MGVEGFLVTTEGAEYSRGARDTLDVGDLGGLSIFIVDDEVGDPSLVFFESLRAVGTVDGTFLGGGEIVFKFLKFPLMLDLLSLGLVLEVVELAIEVIANSMGGSQLE